MNASLTEYLRDLADWIHHEAFHKLPDELEEKADEVRELAQTLESGVVVVPVEVAQTAVQAIDDMMLLANEAGLAPQPGALERIMSAREALSRLQQNWEQSAETRITVTIDVQTWQGYHDRRVIEVEPGIGWPERMAPEVLKAALEMEEQFLRRGLQQNGGEER